MRIANENEAMYGKEPSVEALLDPTAAEWSSALSEALNWYNFSPTKEEKKKWFLDYLQEVGGDVQIASLVPDFNFISAGTIARLWSRGVKNDNFQKKLEDYTSKILKEGKSLSKFSAETAAKKSALKSALLSREVSEAINHIDTVLDGFIETGKTTFDAASWIRSNKVSKEAQEAVQNRFQKLLDEVLASDTDPDLKEGYSNYTKKQKTLLVSLLTDIVNTKIAKVPGVRKPRKKKAVSPEKMVKRLKYMKSYKDLKLDSIDPTIIVGATSLWVYNTKYRILTNYVSDSGLAVKGSTLLNINEQETKSKKLRKPEVTIPEVLTAGKVPLRKVFDNLTTGFLNANGRINKDTILLRVVK
jgi:hypothetical protein